MKHGMLALRFRPRSFDDVCGQRVPVKVIENMLEKDDLPSCLVFIGPRGSGKTSMARLVAASLNCDSASSCGSCKTCDQIITGSSSMYAIEVDAGNVGSVKAIRALLEDVSYSLTHRWRVVIIDECHNLSPAAFAALLKTLEEPPANVLFVLVTTEYGKVPDTIISRSVMLPFSRISLEAVTDRLMFVLEQIGVGSAQTAAALIARRADGSIRDALMLAQQILYVHDEITIETIKDVLGGGIRKHLFELHMSIQRQDFAETHKLAQVITGREVSGLEVLDEFVRLEVDLLDAMLAGKTELESVDGEFDIANVSMPTCLALLKDLWRVRRALSGTGIRSGYLLSGFLTSIAGRDIASYKAAPKTAKSLLSGD